MDTHTLWFKTTQIVSEPGSLEPAMSMPWTGVPEGNEGSWAMAKPMPSPYLFVEQWPKCKEGSESSGNPGLDEGMVWHGNVVKTPEPSTLVEAHVSQHVLSVVQEQMLTNAEGTEAEIKALRQELVQLLAAQKGDSGSASTISPSTEALALTAFVLSTVVTALAVCIAVLRFASPAHVYRAFSDYPHTKAATAEMASL
mmetsp:Transcript_13507/g.38382  ORF Transcript_13507/g.38382 Transcript_13507/m.38382 type:complete len:198 (+) Transcript_13507:49-642(+)